jgi:sulfate adenylyltransferase subunit 2
MDQLGYLESESVYVIREAYARYKKLAMLWSMGKDSTALLWMVRKAFLGRVPIPVVHIDTSYKFKEIYEFRDRIAAEWNLDLRIARNDAALAAGMGPSKIDKLSCCHALKTEALKQAIANEGFDALLLGIRRDEHGVRAKERYFSPRRADFTWSPGSQPPELWDLYSTTDDAAHDRIHPLLHLTEVDIWHYTLREGIPVNSLYFAEGDKRYRSIGCASCCAPIPSRAATVPEIVAEIETATDPERAGRAQDKESAYTMQKLRSLGYM